jgi:hypothetical protein
MTSTSLVEPELDAPRPRPNPGYRVAPPVADAFAPWVSVLDEDLDAREYQWVLGADGALVPMALPAEEPADATGRRTRLGRFAHLLGR